MSKTGGELGDKPARARRTKTVPMEALDIGLERMVADYLIGHTNFFDRHPEVLSKLNLTHAAGGATSLIEHQVKVLRRELEAERGRLAQLIARARDYETFSARLHSLVLQLVGAADLDQVRAALHEALMREFSAQAVTLKVFALDPADPELNRDPVAGAFREFLGLERALCGPLDAEQNRILFGDLGAQVQCAALVPIRGVGCCGVLAIGAEDPDRFKPDMGTDLLDRLGEILSHKLRVFPVPARPAEPTAQGPTGQPAKKPAQATPAPKRTPRKRKPQPAEEGASE